MTIRQQISLYLQDLLSAQYKVSSQIEHRPTKGDLREEFIKRVVCDSFDGMHFYKGILEVGSWQSPEIDFIWLRESSRIGSFRVFDGNDCKLFMEIKSIAKKDEMEYLNQYAKEIKSRCQPNRVKAGMFCYCTQTDRRTVLKDFGFKYDRSIKAFKSYDKKIDIFPNIDFLFGLDLQSKNKKSYLVVRDFYGGNSLFLKEPVIDYFLDLFKK